MSTFTEHTTNEWWQQLRPRLTILYIIIALILLIISGAGHLRLLRELGQTFGGFFWATDTDGRVAVVSTPTQLPPFGSVASTLSGTDYIVAINGEQMPTTLTNVYQQARPGEPITYTIQDNNGQEHQLTRPA